MDIERLKKVNQLAVSLRQRGLADGRDDAARLAGEMNFGMQDEGFNQVMSCMDQPEQVVLDQAQEGTESMSAQPKQEQPCAPGMDEERVTEILQCFADQFVKEINALNDKVSQQEQTINKMVAYLEELNSQPQQSQPAQQPVAQPSQEQKVEKQETINVKEEKPNHSTGNFNSDDVSIEKFFYYGTK